MIIPFSARFPFTIRYCTFLSESGRRRTVFSPIFLAATKVEFWDWVQFLLGIMFRMNSSCNSKIVQQIFLIFLKSFHHYLDPKLHIHPISIHLEKNTLLLWKVQIFSSSDQSNINFSKSFQEMGQFFCTASF